MAAAQLPAPDAPPRDAPLWPHQAAALEQARLRRRLLVAHACGAGKTRTALEFLLEAQPSEAAPGLVVAPLSAHQSVWKPELESAGLAYGAVRSARAPRPRAAHLVLCTAETLRRALLAGWQRDAPVVREGRRGELRHALDYRRAAGHWLLDGPFSAVVVDEAHEARDAACARARAVAEACAKAPCALGLTGTPVVRQGWELRGILLSLAISPAEVCRAPLDYVHRAAAPPRGAPPALCAPQLELFSLSEMDAEAAHAYNQQLGLAKARECESRCLQRVDLASIHPVLLRSSLAGRRLSAADLAEVRARGSPALRLLAAALARLRAEGHRLAVVSAPQTRVLLAAQAYLAAQGDAPEIYSYTGSQTELEREAQRRAFVGAAGPAVLFLSQKAGGQALSLVPASAVLFLGLWCPPRLPPHSAPGNREIWAEVRPAC